MVSAGPLGHALRVLLRGTPLPSQAFPTTLYYDHDLSYAVHVEV